MKLYHQYKLEKNIEWLENEIKDYNGVDRAFCVKVVVKLWRRFFGNNWPDTFTPLDYYCNYESLFVSGVDFLAKPFRHTKLYISQINEPFPHATISLRLDWKRLKLTIIQR